LTNVFFVLNIIVTFLLLVVSIYSAVVLTYGFSDYIWHEKYREKRNISMIWESTAIILLVIFLIAGVRGVVSQETLPVKEFSLGPVIVLPSSSVNYSIFISVLCFILLYIIVFVFSIKEYQSSNNQKE